MLLCIHSVLTSLNIFNTSAPLTWRKTAVRKRKLILGEKPGRTKLLWSSIWAVAVIVNVWEQKIHDWKKWSLRWGNQVKKSVIQLFEFSLHCLPTADMLPSNHAPLCNMKCSKGTHRHTQTRTNTHTHSKSLTNRYQQASCYLVTALCLFVMTAEQRK